MRRASIIFVSALVWALSAAGQQRIEVDYDAVREKVEQGRSYDELIARFTQDAGALTVEEVALVYYGIPFRGEYSGQGTVSYDIYVLCCDKDYEAARLIGEKALEKAPASIPILAGHLNTLCNLDRPAEEVAYYRTRYDSIVRAIRASGDGISPATAFRVVDASSEDAIVSDVLGGRNYVESRINWKNNVTYYKVEPTEKYPHRWLHVDFDSPWRDDYKDKKY